MIGYLPTTLEVAGKEYSICSDYRVALVIFEAFDDPELNEYDKMAVMLDCLYKEPDSIPREACNEAIEKRRGFLMAVRTIKKQVNSDRKRSCHGLRTKR